MIALPVLMVDESPGARDTHDMPPLVPCPHCRAHCKMIENDCPHCGSKLRTREGIIPITAAAAILGLSMAAGCSDSDTVAAPEYGVPAVAGSGGMTSASGGAGGAGGDTGGSAGSMAAPEYGVPGVGGGGGN